MPEVDVTKQLLIDLDNDGIVSPAGANEDVTAYIRQGTPLRMRYGRDQIKELSPLAAGFVEGLLDNQTQRFSDDNASSPIYGQFVPNRLVIANAILSGVTYQVGAGYLQFPDEHPLRTEQNVRFVAYDALGRFNTQDVETAMFTSITTGAAIGKVLDAMGWPSGKRRIDTGITTMTRWRATAGKGFAHIRELVLTEGPPAIAYIDLTTEEFVFEDRHYRWLTSRCTSSQATFRDTGTEPCYSKSDPKAPADNIVNDVTVLVRSWASTAGQALIVGGPTLPLALAAGQSAVFPVTTNADAFDSAVASVTTTSGSQSNSFDRTSGKTANLTVTAGASGCVISAVGVTATTYAISTTPVSNTVTAAVQASRDKYGTRTLPDDLKPLWLPSSDALPYCDYVASRYLERVRQNTIELNNADSARALQGLTRKVSDRITINDSRSGSSDDYFVEQREVQLLPGSNLAAYLGCEKASAQSYWRLGVAGYSELGLTTRLIFALAGFYFLHLTLSALTMFSWTAQA